MRKIKRIPKWNLDMSMTQAAGKMERFQGVAFTNAAKVVGDKLLRDFTADDFQNYADALEARGCKASYVYRQCSFIMAAFRELDIDMQRPDTREYHPTIQVDKRLTMEQYDIIREKARGGWLCWLIMAVETGMRRGEIATLRFRDLDIEGGFIYLTEGHTKTGMRRRIPMSPRVRWVVGKVFMTLRDGYDKTFEELTCDRLNATRMMNYHSKKLGIKIPFHGLRHTFISHLLDENMPVHEVRELAGHTTLNTTGIYAHSLHKHDPVVRKAFGTNDMVGRKIW